MMNKLDPYQLKNLDGKGKGLAVLLVLLILLPIIFGGVYVSQYVRPRADAACPAENVVTTRVAENEGIVKFDTSCEVKAELMCAAGRNGIKFFCGSDEAPTTQHVISTNEVTLSTNVGYYVFIDTQVADQAVAYIRGSVDNPTYGLNYELYNDQTMGSVEGDETYDPALDINQDGVIGVMDRIEFYDNVE